MGCWTRTEVTYFERWPYSICSLLPWIIGEAFSVPGVAGWSPAAPALPAVPSVIPPANATPALSNSLRLFCSESMGFPSDCDLINRRHDYGDKCERKVYAALLNLPSANLFHWA